MGTRQQIMTIIWLAQEIKLLIQYISSTPNEKKIHLFFIIYIYISFLSIWKYYFEWLILLYSFEITEWDWLTHLHKSTAKPAKEACDQGKL